MDRFRIPSKRFMTWFGIRKWEFWSGRPLIEAVSAPPGVGLLGHASPSPWLIFLLFGLALNLNDHMLAV